MCYFGRYFQEYAEAHNAADAQNFAKVDTLTVNGKEYYKASAWVFGGAVRSLPYCLPVATRDGTFMKSLKMVCMSYAYCSVLMACIPVYRAVHQAL